MQSRDVWIWTASVLLYIYAVGYIGELHGWGLVALAYGIRTYKNLFCGHFGQIILYEICTNENFPLYSNWGYLMMSWWPALHVHVSWSFNLILQLLYWKCVCVHTFSMHTHAHIHMHILSLYTEIHNNIYLCTQL